MSGTTDNSTLAALRGSRLVRVGLLGLLAYLANLYGLPVSGRTEFLFGGSIVLTVAVVLGPGWGVGVAVCAALAPAIRWDNPVYLVLAAGEALVLSGCVRRWKKCPGWVAVATYWVLLGCPTLFVFYVYYSGVSAPSIWVILGKHILNGVVWSWFATQMAESRFIHRLFGSTARPDDDKPLRQSLRRSFALSASLPLIASGFFFVRNMEEVLRKQAAEHLVANANALAVEVSAYLAEHRHAITTLAAQVSTFPPKDWDRQLAIVGHAHQGFITLLASDEVGRLTAAYPSHAPDGRPNIATTLEITDRLYYRVPMRTGQPYMSGVFQGRGFGSDLIVALSAPYRDPTGKVAGIVEGSLNLGRINASLSQHITLPAAEAIVCDSQHRIIVAHPNIGLQIMDNIRLHPLFSLHDTPGQVQEIPQQRRALVPGLLYAATSVPVGDTGWRVILRQPLTTALAPLYKLYLSTLGAIILAILVAHRLSHRAVRQITSPVEQVAAAAAALTPGASRSDTLNVPPGTPAEISLLAASLREMTDRLHHAYREVQTTADERGRLNEELKKLLAELDQRVRDRTAELEHARAAAVAASKAKSEFLAVMSHEIRTPLNGVIGMAELLAQAPLPARQAEQARIISLSGQTLLSLVNDILDFSRIEAGVFTLLPDDFSPATLVRDSLAIISPRADARKLRLYTRLDPRLPEILHGDSGRIRQVLINLLGNAVKFTASGSIIASVDVLAADEPTCRLRFTVTDTGIGIAADKLELIFEPFKQSDSGITRHYGGTGLGLAISRKLTELMGGRIWVESTVGIGSRFTFELPLGRPRATGTDNHAAPAAPPAAGHRILVVDDDEVNLRVAELTLCHLGHDVTLASNGHQALEQLARTDFDLVFLDLRMPGMSGFEAVDELRRRERGTTRRQRVIALTADVTAETIAECRRHDFDHWLTKPVKTDDLRAAIDGRPALPLSRPGAWD